MPRPRKGARLWLRPERRDAAGKLVSRAAWFILDAGKHIATGCTQGQVAAAESKLAEYIAGKYTPTRTERELTEIRVADVLSIYVDDCAPDETHDKTQRKRFDARIGRLNDWWGNKLLSEVNKESCAAYVKSRGKPGGARRDLEDLKAAINHHQEEGLHRAVVKVVLPPKGAPRDRWLTRSEAAALLWACWRYREVQRLHRGRRNGEFTETDKRPLRHLARFILIGLYTGTRAGAIASASPIRGEGRSFVDLDRSVFYRLAEGKKATKKRQPPAPIPPRLLAHLRRWAKADEGKRTYFVEWNGEPVASVKTGFKHAVKLAKLAGKVSPHTLRHTAATWLMQNGVDIWMAAGFLGMSAEMVDRVYGHHHPDYLSKAAHALSYRTTPSQSLVISLEMARKKRETPSQGAEIIGGPGRTRTCNQTVMSGRL
jgi:integrase